MAYGFCVTRISYPLARDYKPDLSLVQRLCVWSRTDSGETHLHLITADLWCLCSGSRLRCLGRFVGCKEAAIHSRRLSPKEGSDKGALLGARYARLKLTTKSQAIIHCARHPRTISVSHQTQPRILPVENALTTWPRAVAFFFQAKP